MKLIIAGTRTIHLTPELITEYMVKSGIDFHIDEVVSGGAMGVDQSGELWAKKYNIPIKIFKADWDKYGKSAGPKRNRQMALYGDALLLIWDGRSKGSANMKREALNANKNTYEVIVSTVDNFRKRDLINDIKYRP